MELAVELDGVVTDPFGNEKLAVSARTEINREDFGMTWNAALETGGVLVSQKVVDRDRGPGGSPGLTSWLGSLRPVVLPTARGAPWR